MDGQNSAGASRAQTGKVCPVCKKEFGAETLFCDADGTLLADRPAPPKASAADRGGFTSDEMQQMLKQIFGGSAEQPMGGAAKASGNAMFNAPNTPRMLPSKKQMALSILLFLLSMIVCFSYTSFTRVLGILSVVVWGLVIAYNITRLCKQRQSK